MTKCSGMKAFHPEGILVPVTCDQSIEERVLRVALRKFVAPLHLSNKAIILYTLRFYATTSYGCTFHEMERYRLSKKSIDFLRLILV